MAVVDVDLFVDQHVAESDRPGHCLSRRDKHDAPRRTPSARTASALDSTIRQPSDAMMWCAMRAQPSMVVVLHRRKPSGIVEQIARGGGTRPRPSGPGSVEPFRINHRALRGQTRSVARGAPGFHPGSAAGYRPATGPSPRDHHRRASDPPELSDQRATVVRYRVRPGPRRWEDPPPRMPEVGLPTRRPHPDRCPGVGARVPGCRGRTQTAHLPHGASPLLAAPGRSRRSV